MVLARDLSTMGGSEAANGKRLVSNIVIQNVRVLGMDLNADPSSTQAAVAHTATWPDWTSAVTRPSGMSGASIVANTLGLALPAG